MLSVSESMAVPLENFVRQLLSGELHDPEILSRSLCLLAMTAMLEAHEARLVRQRYRKAIALEIVGVNAGWADLSEV